MESPNGGSNVFIGLACIIVGHYQYMIPAFNLFGKTLGIYPIMALAGIFAAGIYSCVICKKSGHDDNDAIILLLIAAIGVLLGSHLLYGIVNYRIIIYLFNNPSLIDSWQTVLEAVVLIFGGSVFYGGLFGGILAAFIYLRKRPQQRYLVDIVTPAIPLFHFFGRIGCFLAGCCFGKESAIGFTYRYSPIGTANGVSRFPVQLLESSFNLALFFILHYLRRKGFFKQKLIYVYLLCYATARFFIEFLRGDSYRGMWFFLSTSQIISILILLLVPVRLYMLRKKTINISASN